jgi:hypothetical protein
MTVQSRLLSFALVLASVQGCGARTIEPSGSLPNQAVRSGPTLDSTTDPPFAYVAQRCRSNSSCSAPNGLVQMLGGPAITSDIDNPNTLALDGSGNLYVGNSTSSNEGDVSVYAAQSVNPLRILRGIAGVPEGLVANAAGRLVVVGRDKAGCCQFVGSGGIYPPGATMPRRRVKGLSGFAHSPVQDKLGNLYVANFDVFPGWVSVYKSGHHAPSRVINDGIGLPIQLAVAPSGALVVLNGLFSGGYDVTLYQPGANTPSLTIAAGLHECTAVAVDASGNVYVANGRDLKRRGEVTVYRSGQTTVWRSIRSGLTFPGALAFDALGRLYVANVPRKGPNAIVVFAAGGSKLLQTYRLKEQFAALAVPH